MPTNLIVGYGKGFDPKAAEQEEDDDGKPVIRDDNGNIVQDTLDTDDELESDDDASPPRPRGELAKEILFGERALGPGMANITSNIAEFAGTRDVPGLPLVRRFLHRSHGPASNNSLDAGDSDSDDGLSTDDRKKNRANAQKQLSRVEKRIKSLREQKQDARRPFQKRKNDVVWLRENEGELQRLINLRRMLIKEIEANPYIARTRKD